MENSGFPHWPENVILSRPLSGKEGKRNYLVPKIIIYNGKGIQCVFLSILLFFVNTHPKASLRLDETKYCVRFSNDIFCCLFG